MRKKKYLQCNKVVQISVKYARNWGERAYISLYNNIVINNIIAMLYNCLLFEYILKWNLFRYNGKCIFSSHYPSLLCHMVLQKSF